MRVPETNRSSKKSLGFFGDFKVWDLVIPSDEIQVGILWFFSWESWITCCKQFLFKCTHQLRKMFGQCLGDLFLFYVLMQMIFFQCYVWKICLPLGIFVALFRFGEQICFLEGFCIWRRGTWVFHETPLSPVVKNINHNCGWSVMGPGAEIKRNSTE